MFLIRIANPVFCIKYFKEQIVEVYAKAVGTIHFKS